MNTTTAFTVLALTAFQLMSQQTQAQQNPDSIPEQKNEIGVSLVPYILLASTGSDQQSTMAHVFYKRRLNEHLYGRLSLAVNNGSVNDQLPRYASIRTASGTDVYLESRDYSGRNYLQYMAGIENRWGRQQVQQFAGVDLGYAHFKSETRTYTHTLASTTGIVSDSAVSHYRYTNNALSVSPFYGLIFNCSRHFFLTAQVGLNLQFTARNEEKVFDTRNAISTSGRVAYFDLKLGSVANHVSVCYRF